jgi:hypothetical protein
MNRYGKFNHENPKVSKALQEAWRFIYQWYDEGAFIQMLDWKISFKDNPDATKLMQMLADVEAWKGSVMNEYLMVKKPAILSNTPFTFTYDHVGDAPYTFTQLFVEVASILQEPEDDNNDPE